MLITELPVGLVFQVKKYLVLSEYGSVGKGYRIAVKVYRAVVDNACNGAVAGKIKGAAAFNGYNGVVTDGRAVFGVIDDVYGAG